MYMYGLLKDDTDLVDFIKVMSIRLEALLETLQVIFLKYNEDSIMTIKLDRAFDTNILPFDKDKLGPSAIRIGSVISVDEIKNDDISMEVEIFLTVSLPSIIRYLKMIKNRFIIK